jgi:hypothetical protein
MPLLGTSRRPLFLKGTSFEEADHLLALCEDQGWEAIVVIDPDAPSDLRDLRKAERQSEFAQEIRTFQQPAANGPCPCGSGRKYKRCCQAA